MQDKTRQRPILRWAGSKRRLIPQLLELAPSNFGRYFEPFAGSACLLFALRPDNSVLGDVNSALIETYEALRKSPNEVYDMASAIPATEQMYYTVRAQDPSTLPPLERAARFFYLNRHCFNGVYRTNQRGNFNVPFGSATGAMPSREEFVNCSRLLSSCELRAGDFESTISDAKEDDFIYLDPPYTTTSRRGYGEYGYSSFSHKDFPRLVECLHELDNKGVKVLLSYSQSALTDPILSLWQCHNLTVRRHIAGFAQHRAVVPEVLISNLYKQ
jgi:DNA adenine methylase